jgi:hypothetical protein
MRDTNRARRQPRSEEKKGRLLDHGPSCFRAIFRILKQNYAGHCEKCRARLETQNFASKGVPSRLMLRHGSIRPAWCGVP